MQKFSTKLLMTVVVCLLSTGHVSSSDANHTIFFTGTISGKITHADGVTPIPGATVKALQGTTVIATTTTNGTGDYVLPSLSAGSYRVEASASGFGTKSQSLVAVVDSETTTVNLKLDQIVGGPVSYIYDALGRLVAAVGSTDTTIYTYDGVGNLLSISRQPSSQLAIISVVPNRGSVGQTVTINGTGFSATPSQNTVQFNGVGATVLSSTTTSIVTTVPAVGVTGQIQISVTTSQGTATAPFTVVPAETEPSIEVAPRYLAILPAEQLQFYATVSGITGDQSVQWKVNGIQGGDSYVGTITSTGLYTAPNQPTLIFSIRATSVANPAVFGQAQVAILNPSAAQSVVSQSISVLRQPVIDTTQTVALSVRRLASETVGPAISQVSVRRLTSDSVGPSASEVSVRRMTSDSVGASATQVSVRRLATTENGAPISATISVRRSDAVTSGSKESSPVSLTTGPLVQSLTPTSAAQGASFTISISGANFGGATGLTFLTTAGAVDSTITASNISVDPNGTSLTATITVSGSAALGQRVVIVVTSAGHSLAVNTGTNLLEIVQ